MVVGNHGCQGAIRSQKASKGQIWAIQNPQVQNLSLAEIVVMCSWFKDQTLVISKNIKYYPGTNSDKVDIYIIQSYPNIIKYYQIIYQILSTHLTLFREIILVHFRERKCVSIALVNSSQFSRVTSGPSSYMKWSTPLMGWNTTDFLTVICWSITPFNII